MSACVRRASAPVRSSPFSSKRSPASAFLHDPNIALSQDFKPRPVSCIHSSETTTTRNNSMLTRTPCFEPAACQCDTKKSTVWMSCCLKP